LNGDRTLVVCRASQKGPGNDAFIFQNRGFRKLGLKVTDAHPSDRDLIMAQQFSGRRIFDVISKDIYGVDLSDFQTGIRTAIDGDFPAIFPQDRDGKNCFPLQSCSQPRAYDTRLDIRCPCLNYFWLLKKFCSSIFVLCEVGAN
jgi:hypothetical protein